MTTRVRAFRLHGGGEVSFASSTKVSAALALERVPNARLVRGDEGGASDLEILVADLFRFSDAIEILKPDVEIAISNLGASSEFALVELAGGFGGGDVIFPARQTGSEETLRGVREVSSDDQFVSELIHSNRRAVVIESSANRLFVLRRDVRRVRRVRVITVRVIHLIVHCMDLIEGDLNLH